MTGCLSQTHFISNQSWSTSFGSNFLRRFHQIIRLNSLMLPFHGRICKLSFLLLDKVVKMQVISGKVLNFSQTGACNLTFDPLLLFFNLPS